MESREPMRVKLIFQKEKVLSHLELGAPSDVLPAALSPSSGL
jgi:hypothetical protein